MKFINDCYDYNFIYTNWEVLGLETLKQIDYVYCEVNRDEVYENNAYVEEIDNFLSDYDMTRVETDWAGDIWGDDDKNENLNSNNRN